MDFWDVHGRHEWRYLGLWVGLRDDVRAQGSVMHKKGDVRVYRASITRSGRVAVYDVRYQLQLLNTRHVTCDHRTPVV